MSKFRFVASNVFSENEKAEHLQRCCEIERARQYTLENSEYSQDAIRLAILQFGAEERREAIKSVHVSQEQMILAAKSLVVRPSKNMERIFTENEFAGITDFHNAYKQFNEELSDAFRVLRYDEGDSESEQLFGNMQLDKLFAEAELQRQIDRMINEGTVSRSQLLERINELNQKKRPVGRPRGEQPLTGNEISMLLRIEERIRKGLSVEDATGYESVSRATFFRWREKYAKSHNIN